MVLLRTTKILALRIEIAIENSTGANARWSVVPEPNLSGSKFLNRADASDVDPKAIGFAANEFLVTQSRAKIGALTWNAFSFARGAGRAQLRTRARTDTRAGESRSASDEARRVRDPHASDSARFAHGDARRGEGASVPSRDRERATDAMSAALAAAQNKADLHRVTTEERLFHSEYNVPPGHAAAPNEVRWALRGYLPPKHLRIDGYNYGIPEDTEAVFEEYAPDIVKRESTSALMAGCFVHESEPADEGMDEGISVGTITMST